MTSAARVRAYRARQKAAGKVDSSQRHRKEYRDNARRVERVERLSARPPFVGCDGEGCGTDDLGRQLYMLFRMGERELFTGEALSTQEILDFICDEPKGSILVGFSFGYDVTMILRDLPANQQMRLFQPKESEEGKSRYTWYKNFDIEYLPKQYFRVRRSVTVNGKRKPVKDSARTIYETFGFFQCSFVKAINNFDCGTKYQREQIALNKTRRSDFDVIDKTERDYCALECELLSELITKLRDYCYAAGIYPHSWNGAGKLAAALHKTYETIQANEVKERVPRHVLDLANMAYYGGRFEITRTGYINQPVYEYDIRSAYPDAMRKLPCLKHGKWSEANAGEIRAASKAGKLYVAAITFDHRESGAGRLYGFPVRTREGHLFWPKQGGGVYWSPEIEAAKAIGAKVHYRAGWIYEKQCQCDIFGWVETLYEYRRSIGSNGPGYPIKLGINSLYGKLAQRIGNGKYSNMVWAGLITAFTRAKLLEAIALAPGRIVMLATDGIYSLDPLPVVEGTKLGEWEHEKLDGLFIVQPGLYWCPAKRKRKSRGLPGKFFEENGRTESFEALWREYIASGATGNFPTVSVPMINFIGLKLALSWGKPEKAGVWEKTERTISFDYTNKRERHLIEGSHIVTFPKAGRPGLVSLPHRDFLLRGGNEPWENARAMLEDQPDYVDLGPPFKD